MSWRFLSGAVYSVRKANKGLPWTISWIFAFCLTRNLAKRCLYALFAKLHRALGARGKGDIGVSFPEFSVKPGPLLRLHGDESALCALEETLWRKGLNDYCQSGQIMPVGEIQGWRCVSRVQVKSSPERLMRRSVRKGWLTQDEANERLLSMRGESTALPG